MQLQADYYIKLNSSDESVSFKLLNKTGIYLTKKEKQSIEGPIPMEEIEIALKQTSVGKSPGVNGLDVEIYCKLWPYIKTTLYNALIYAYEVNKLHISAHRRLITLIPKKERFELR